MNKVRVLIVAIALLTAACGTATISGSSVKSVSTSGNVGVEAGANAGTDLSAAEDDLGRPNPPIRKGPGGPVPVQQSLQPSTNGTQPSTSASDRCSAGFGSNPGVGSRAGTRGTHPPLPECAVE